MNINGNNGGQQHWQLEVDAQGVAWATLNKAGESTNSLSSLVMDELSQLLDQLDRSPPKGLIFRSGKAAGFIAGADIQEFTRLDTPQKGIELVSRGWQLFNRLAGVSYPTLALVRGHCLGGGASRGLNNRGTASRRSSSIQPSGTTMASACRRHSTPAR